jgi:hypothetical protein
MLKEFIEKIIDMVPTQIIELECDNDRRYSNKPMHPIKVRTNNVMIHTLSGLIEFIKNTTCIYGIQIINTDEVSLLKEDCDWNETYPICTAKCFKSSNPFNYGYKYDIETFIIKLQSEFVQNDDRDSLLRLVSSLTSGSSQTNEDDGISQKVTIKRGVTLKGEAVINPRVNLRPYRTFHEVEQPESAYIFRVYQEENAQPKVSLHEADGAIWQHEAVLNILSYLKNNDYIKENNINIIY